MRHHRGEGLRSKQSAHFGENPALWHSGDHSEIALGYHRSRFGKNMLAGPAVVEQMDTTTVIHPEQQARVDDYKNLIITAKE